MFKITGNLIKHPQRLGRCPFRGEPNLLVQAIIGSTHYIQAIIGSIDFVIFCLNQGIDFINFCLKLDCLQSAFSLKIRPDETRKDLQPVYRLPPSLRKKKNVSFFFFSGLRPRFSRQQASPLACLGFACSNFAKKNK